MISRSNTDVVQTLETITGFGLECSFLVPTRTGLEKSILDATESTRILLAEKNVHNYYNQPQGPEGKVLIRALIVDGESISESTASLYRPKTKSGDPRIWFSGLKDKAKEYDLLAIFVTGNSLVMVNCTTTKVGELFDDRSSLLWRVLVTKTISLTTAQEVLLDKLRQVSAEGFIPTMRRGDTGIGFTLESSLGIAANSSKKADFKGIEIKASRSSSKLSGRVTIFSQVPNWNISRLKSSYEILMERGKFSPEKQRQQLYHQISATGPNSYGMFLVVDETKRELHQKFTSDGLEMVNDVRWKLETLLLRLIEKHSNTVWVTAHTRGTGNGESFHYVRAAFSRPRAPNLSLLLHQGVISVDYLIKRLPTGSAKDQGYLFKIGHKNHHLLFKHTDEFDLP